MYLRDVSAMIRLRIFGTRFSAPRFPAIPLGLIWAICAIKDKELQVSTKSRWAIQVSPNGRVRNIRIY